MDKFQEPRKYFLAQDRAGENPLAVAYVKSLEDESPGKRTQLSIAVEQKFRDRLAYAARGVGMTQRDFVVKAVEDLIEKEADVIDRYYESLANK